MMNQHRTTLKDIAQVTGYSINTVSKALKESPNISSSARERIKRVARELGYVVNASATAMRLGVTKTIAVIVGDISNPHFAIMVKEIEALARQNQYSMIMLNTDEDSQKEADAIEVALSKGVDGIIISPVQKSAENVRRIAQAQVPFVLIGRYFDDMPTNAVVCDDRQGGEVATEHLLQLGHRRICFINGPEYVSSARERLDGYLKAHQKAGVPVDQSLIYTVSLQQETRMGQLEEIVPNANATAFFAFSDVIAWEIVSLLQKNGQRVPEDISVIGFDNLLSKLPYPFPLTSVRTSKTLISVEALKMLMDQMGRPFDPNGPVSRQVVSTSVSVRGSTKQWKEKKKNYR